MEAKKKSLGVASLIVVLVGVTLSWAGAHNGALVGAMPVFALCGMLAFLINWLVFIPSAIAKTERYYDLVGSFTYLIVTGVAVYFAPALDLRSKVVALMVGLWAVRLGSFLFLRIRKRGHDDRFNEIKLNPFRFFFAWTLQGLWVLFTAACALVIITSNVKSPIGLLGVVGIVIWLIGFLCEVIADEQKRVFQSDPNNYDRFINVGLWSCSRHPNYFGEIVLWTGIAIIAVPILDGWQWLTLISPIFVYLLLTRVSGIPMLSEKAQERWGQQEAYQDYLNKTRLLVPLPLRDH